MTRSRDLLPVPNLDEGLADDAASALRMIAETIPVVGGVLAELADLIPGQREQRVADFVKRLGEALNRLGVEHEDLRSRVRSDAARLELLERGAVAAARASGEERRSYTAELVARGLTEEERAADEVKKLLNVLDDLTDAEVVTLIYRSSPGELGRRSEFYTHHEETLRPVSREIGIAREEQDRAALQESYVRNLQRLGLVQDTGPGGAELVTPFGRLFLRYIGIGSDGGRS